MDVELYVYDLSNGMARQMSRAFLGVQIDAVYHTALVFGGIEYYFGAGVQTSYPGATHHGRPMEVVPLGATDLPIEIILEYLESLKEIYTAESYDLFTHNCNNFTHDFATFLVGHGIPEHISSLPRTVLDTPFGQMLRPQLDSAMRGVTQAPTPPQSVIRSQARAAGAPSNGTKAPRSAPATRATTDKSSGEVYNVTTPQRLDQLLASARSSSAVLFFTSSTCAPCRLVYPTYDQLAAETQGKCWLIKIDISNAHHLASRYSIRATPTFISFLRGKQDSTWTGASPPQLQGNVRMLVEAAFPPHPHQQLSLSTFRRQSSKFVLYNKVPPMDKLRAKLGPESKDNAVESAIAFIKQRDQAISQEAPIPDMSTTSRSFQRLLADLPAETKFIALDILRLLLIDPRISGYYISSPVNIATLAEFFQAVTEETPYTLRLCALHVACNIFTAQPNLLLDSGVLADQALTSSWLALAATAMLDREKPTLRNAAANLAYNLATAQMEARMAALESGTAHGMNAPGMPTAAQVELAAALIEALNAEEESADAVRWMAVALARLVYLCPRDDEEQSELLDLCVAMEAGDVVLGKEKVVIKGDRVLLHEIGSVLLKQGVRATGK